MRLRPELTACRSSTDLEIVGSYDVDDGSGMDGLFVLLTISVIMAERDELDRTNGTVRRLGETAGEKD